MFTTYVLVLSAVSVAFAQNETTTEEPTSTMSMTEFFTSTGVPMDLDMSTTVMGEDTTTTATTTTFAAEECGRYTWFRRVVFEVSLLVNPEEAGQQAIIAQSLKKSFYDAVSANYTGEFCFDLPLEKLDFYELARRRRLLLQTATAYQVSAEFVYDDALESGFFANEDESLYHNPTFEAVFGQSLKVALVEAGAVEDDGAPIAVVATAALALEEEEEERNPLVSAVTILAIVDVILFLFTAVHFVRETLPRAGESKEAEYKNKFSLVFALELVAFIIYFALAIRLMASLESYLGYILLCLFLTGVIVFAARIILSTRLMTQIEKLRTTAAAGADNLSRAIIDRRTDFGVLGLLLCTYMDGPVLIIAIVAGDEHGYTGLEVVAMLFAIVCILTKFATLVYARCAKDTRDAEQAPMQKEIEMAQDKDKDTAAAQDVEAQRAAPETTNQNDVQEEQPATDDAPKADAGAAQNEAPAAASTDNDAPKADDAGTGAADANEPNDAQKADTAADADNAGDAPQADAGDAPKEPYVE